MQGKSKKNILLFSFIALFAAIICLGAFMNIPIGPVPIALQNVLCLLSAILLGGLFASFPTGLFLLAGLLGLPVYSGGKAGLAVWAGPTGGFLLGYFLAAFLAGLIAGRPSVKEKKFSVKVFIRLLVAFLLGMIVLYIPGIFHFAKWASTNGKVPFDKSAFSYTMAACVIPFIPGDIIKILVCLPVALKIRPILAQYLYSKKNKNDFSEAPVDKNN